MELDKELYNQLRDLRMYIKQDGKHATGIAPSVCSDETLINITKFRPRRVEDFAGIPGIGEVFVKKYAKYFLEVIELYEETEGEEKLKLSENAVGTMRTLQEKLVNINRRNRLLYIPRLYAKNDYDLYSEDAKIIDFLFNEDNSSYTVCDATDGSDESAKVYKGLVTLLREIKREITEKGINNLYVAYPFVNGCLKDEDFKIRCPLALFPVNAIRSGKKITISFDESRDVLFNRTLILAHYKFEEIEKNLPDTAFEGSGKEEFVTSLLNFYKTHGINISNSDDSLIRFSEYTKDSFPSFEKYEMKMEPCAVLGRYSICDSALMHDFDVLIARGKINNNMAELLAGAEELDKKPWLNSAVSVNDEVECIVSDSDITYISAVDASQEKVLNAIKENDKLVIQGPPGTGKSQVITNLIAQFATEGKRVLLVSEKKTALDVVQSRLGELSKYALLIDDVGNKSLFYKQILEMTSSGTSKPAGTNESYRASRSIDFYFGMLTDINNSLYKVGEFGIEPYKLFTLTKPDAFCKDGSSRAEMLKSAWNDIPEELFTINYSELKHIYNVLNQQNIKSTVTTYMRILRDYPFIANAKRGLNAGPMSLMINELIAFSGKVVEADNSIFPRGALRRLERPAKKLVNRYFDSEKDTVVAIILTDPYEVINGFKCDYDEYDRLVRIIDTYESNVKQFIYTVSKLRRKIGDKVVNFDFVFDSIVRFHISRFLTEHADAVKSAENFKSILRQINQYVSAKEDYSKKYLGDLLSESANRMTTGKRGEEIAKIAGGSRKWNVNRFLNKYSFEVFGAVKIWLLTPEVVSEIIPLDTGVFDLVIFDEASQMFVEKGLPAIYRAKKIVIAGDSKQLRPSNLGVGRINNSYELDTVDECDEETVDGSDNDSLLELARYKYPDIWLNTHYRAKKDELISFSNYAFYENKLKIAPNIGKSNKPPIEYVYVKDGCFTKQTNINEARRVVDILKMQLDTKSSESTIGVITFNASQRDLILDLIDEECDASPEWKDKFEREINRSGNGEDKGLFVKNIESVQGDERDIIIFSIGYALNEEGKFVRYFGWLNQRNGENRLNVAITRAKLKEIVVTSLMPEEFNVDGIKNEGPKVLRKFLEYAKYVSDGQKTLAQNLLESMCDNSTQIRKPKENAMSENVYDELKKKLPKQYEVKNNPMVTEDGIDLLIYKNGQVIAGIEFDSTVYPAFNDTRARDYHRYRLLSSKGWTIYRVFSVIWWIDPEGMTDDLVSQIVSI